MLVGIRLPARQVDANNVVWRSGLQLGPLGLVDHVVGRRHYVLEAAGLSKLVVQRQERLELGHSGGGGYSTSRDARAPTGSGAGDP